MAETEQYIEHPSLENDIVLLRQYARSQEPAAFVELSRRHAGAVYGACLRITANVQDAEELTQDCFFELARRAATIRSSVGGWLHSLATHRAMNAVRSRNRRRQREQRVAAASSKEQADSEAEVAWRHLEPLLDQAIDGLPEELRTPIILHFLENRPQSEVALRLGVHQSTVSRHIQEALEALRARLRESGFVMAVAPLTSLLTTHAGQTADPHLLTSLTKIALAGVGSTATGNAIGGVGTALAKLSTWAKALGTLAAPIFVQLLLGGWWGVAMIAMLWTYIAWRQPNWFEELAFAMAGTGARYEFFPFSRWTWTTPPPGWQKMVRQSLLCGGLLGTTPVAMFLEGGEPGMVATWAMIAVLPLLNAARIWMRVQRCVRAGKEQVAGIAEPLPDRIAIVQSGCFGAVAALGAVSFIVLIARSQHPGVYILVGSTVMPIAAIVAIADAIGKIRRYRRGRMAQGPTQARNMAACEPIRPRTTLATLLVVLAFAGLWTQGALRGYFRAPVGATVNVMDIMQRVVALAFLPMLALMVLVATIRLLGRLWARIPMFFWWLLAAIAAACATLNLVILAIWLFSSGWPPVDWAAVHRTMAKRRENNAFHWAIKDSDPKVWVRAAMMLGDIGKLKSDAAAMPELRKFLTDQDEEVRRRAAIAMSFLDAPAKDVVPELRRALSDEEWDIRQKAALMLGHYGPAAKDAVPELLKALSDEEQQVRFMAAIALQSIGPAAKDAIPELRRALSDSDSAVRHGAASTLASFGPAASRRSARVAKGAKRREQSGPISSHLGTGQDWSSRQGCDS